MNSANRAAARRHRIVSAAVALGGIGAVASSASAAVILQNGTATGGMTLNASNVLLAAGSYGTTNEANGTYTAGPQVVQGVTFAPMVTATSGSFGVYTLTNGSTGVGITFAAYTSASTQTNAGTGAYSSPGAQYYTTNAQGGTTIPQPSDSSSLALQTIINNGYDYSGGTPDYIQVTISGLQIGSQYTIDLLQSQLGNTGVASRSQEIAFNTPLTYAGGGSNTYTGTPADTVTISTFTTQSSPIFDTNDTVTAINNGSGGGEIVAYIYGSSNPNGVHTPLLEGVVVSATPEPGSLALLGLGGAGLLIRRRRRGAERRARPANGA